MESIKFLEEYKVAREKLSKQRANIQKRTEAIAKEYTDKIRFMAENCSDKEFLNFLLDPNTEGEDAAASILLRSRKVHAEYFEEQEQEEEEIKDSIQEILGMFFSN